MASPSSPASWDRFFCLPRLICSFLLLAQKKRTKEKGSLKSFLGLTFYRLPTHYNSPSLRSGSNSNASQSHPLRNLKNVNLFPKKIWWRCSPNGDLGEISISCMLIRIRLEKFDLKINPDKWMAGFKPQRGTERK